MKKKSKKKTTKKNANFWRFTVPGRLWGYRQGRKEAHRRERVAFKAMVRLLANVVGVPDVVTKKDNVFLDICICWKGEARIDGKNVAGLIEDALWTKDRGVAGGLWTRHIKQPEEEVIVQVWRNFVVRPRISWGDYPGAGQED